MLLGPRLFTTGAADGLIGGLLGGTGGMPCNSEVVRLRKNSRKNAWMGCDGDCVNSVLLILLFTETIKKFGKKNMQRALGKRYFSFFLRIVEQNVFFVFSGFVRLK